MNTTAEPSAQERMIALTRAQPTPRLIGAWKIAAGQFATLPPGSGHFDAVHLSMSVIELVLIDRGLPFCDDCGGPDGNHIPNMPGLCKVAAH